MKKYIGLIRWPDGAVADATSVRGLQKVWQDCCNYTSAYIDGCDIFEAVFNEDGNVIGDLVYSFPDIQNCRERYKQKFGRPYNKGREHLNH